MIRQNPYRFSPPPGWNNITTAPRDGTVIEIQNNWGIAPTYSLCKWVEGRGWQDAADECRGVGDGAHLSWRPHAGDPANYIDPTGGAQDSVEYWDRAVIQATGGLLDPAKERAKNALKRRPQHAPNQRPVRDVPAILIIAGAVVVAVLGAVVLT